MTKPKWPKANPGEWEWERDARGRFTGKRFVVPLPEPEPPPPRIYLPAIIEEPVMPVKKPRPKPGVRRHLLNSGSPPLLALRVGDFKCIVNGKAEIIASMGPPSPWANMHHRRRGRGAE